MKVSSKDIGSKMTPLGQTAWPVKPDMVDLGGFMWSLNFSGSFSKHSSYIMFDELPVSTKTLCTKDHPIRPLMISGSHPPPLWYDSIKGSPYPNSISYLLLFMRDPWYSVSVFFHTIRIYCHCSSFAFRRTSSFCRSLSFFNPSHAFVDWPWHLWNL